MINILSIQVYDDSYQGQLINQSIDNYSSYNMINQSIALDQSINQLPTI
jgi:hypothetical protein